MDELYTYMKLKLTEMHEKRANKVEIDCVEFMQILKALCYMKQIRAIVDDI